MNTDFKLASNLCPFSRLSDRFVPAGYGEGLDFRRQLDELAAIDGIKGVALGWPSQFQNGAALKKALADVGLELAVVEPDIYTEARFKHGSLSAPDAKTRRAAIDRVKGTIDAGLEAGSPDMNLWLAQDGFDYFFQGHYADAWKWLIEGLQEIAEHSNEMNICLEYKCKEPRAHQYVANAGTALLLATKVNKAHVGITLDLGHSLYCQEIPANCAVLAHREGCLKQVHLNDNYRDWDYDLVPGAVNVWDHVEFFYWIRMLGYPGWFSIDVFPYREDGADALRQSVRTICKCWAMADSLIAMNAEEWLRQGRHLEALRALWDMMDVKLKGCPGEGLPPIEISSELQK